MPFPASLLALTALAILALERWSPVAAPGIATLVLVPGCAALIARSTVPATPTPRILLALAALTAWCALGLAWSAVPSVSRLGFTAPCMALLVAWSMWASPGPVRAARALTLGIAAAAAAAALAGVVQSAALDLAPRSVFEHRHGHVVFLIACTLFLAGRWLATHPRGRRAGVEVLRDPRLWGLAALVTAIATASGRGTFLAFWLGAAVLAWAARRHVATPALVALAVASVLAFAGAEVTAPAAGSAARLGTTAEALQAVGEAPTGADSATPVPQRLLIWRGALDLLADAPWHGLGLGVFFLAFPRYRDALEASAGQHAHNDYLQVAIELGWPGLLLGALVAAAAVRALHRAARRSRIAPEAAGIGGALVAVGVHALVSFPLQLLPVAWILGVLLGRLARLDARRVAPAPAPATGRLRLAGLAALAALVPVVAGPVAGAGLEWGAERAARRAAPAVLVGRLEWAHRLSGSERPLVRLVNVYASALAREPDPARARTLYALGGAALDAATAANPLRPQVGRVGAALHLAATRTGQGDGAARAESELRRALALDPRYLGARRAYAELLLERGQASAAGAVVEAGLALPLRRTPLALPFYALGVRLRAEQGDAAGARALYRQVRAIARRYDMHPGTLARLGLAGFETPAAGRSS